MTKVEVGCIVGMAQLTVDEIATQIGDLPPSEDFWEQAVDVGAGVINNRQKLVEKGDIILVGDTEFEVTSVKDENDTGVFVHRFHERSTTNSREH